MLDFLFSIQLDTNVTFFNEKVEWQSGNSYSSRSHDITEWVNILFAKILSNHIELIFM